MHCFRLNLKRKLDLSLINPLNFPLRLQLDWKFLKYAHIADARQVFTICFPIIANVFALHFNKLFETIFCVFL